ncbi:ABC transporter permease [Ktedonobacteria bacterium brp13]|nr:ABC transporter permease [Ktedonobacteria bacterium brp13]
MQDTLFGLSPTMLALVLVALTAGVLLIIVGFGLNNPLLLRMGIRNTMRRPSQTLIILLGLVLSTAFVTASFGLQDSFADSMKTDRLAKVGNVDESVTGTFSQNQVTQAVTHLRQMPEVQAVSTASITLYGAWAVSERSQLSASDLSVIALPPEFDGVYGPLTDSQGQMVHISDLRPDEVYVSHSAVSGMDIHAGDQIQLRRYGYDGVITAKVKAILSTDLALTTGELSWNGAYPEIILPFSTLQQSFQQYYHQNLVPNAICIKNVGPGGLNDSGPNDSRGHAVTDYLRTFLHGNFDTQGHVPTFFDATIVHPLKPDVVLQTGGFSPIAGKGEIIVSPAARQFNTLLPAFTALLVGAGMLLLALLCLLLAAERRAELGMSRAVGLQRHHLVQSLLIEGCGYGIIAATLGLPLGIGSIALELFLLSHLPSVGELSSAGLQLHVWVSWPSLLISWSLGVITTVGVVLITALWISRANIIAAIRDLDMPERHVHLFTLLTDVFTRPSDAVGQFIPETPSRRFSRVSDDLGSLLWELFVRGPLFLLLGVVLWRQGTAQGDAGTWMRVLGIALLIGGGGLLANWLLRLLAKTLFPRFGVLDLLLERLFFSLIGLGWMISGYLQGKPLFEFVFTSDLSSLATIHWGSPLEVIMCLLLTLAGVVVLVMSNIDLVAELLSLFFRYLRGMVPISRISLIYPLTFRFRTITTVSLLSMITFLIMLVVTNNLSSIQQTDIHNTTGGYQLTVDGLQIDSILPQNDPQRSVLYTQLQNTPQTLRHDIASVSMMRALIDPHGDPTGGGGAPMIHVLLGKNPVYTVDFPSPLVADDAFLTNTTLPMYARARGYDTDRQVWDAVRDNARLAVLKYQGGLGLPSTNGFTPFSIEVPESRAPHAPLLRMTVIGILPINTHWQTAFVSNKTAQSFHVQPYERFTFFYFQLQPGVSTTQASADLSRMLNLGMRGIVVSSLLPASQNGYTTALTQFLAIYLALGLLFGAFSIGVITSRAVVERRQQIGMLRAIGFSRQLVRRSFLLESSFVITVSLLIGTLLAWWIVFQVASEVTPNFPFPVEPVALLLVGGYLITLICTVLPAQQASKVSPAEALRYE